MTSYYGDPSTSPPHSLGNHAEFLLTTARYHPYAIQCQPYSVKKGKCIIRTFLKSDRDAFTLRKGDWGEGRKERRQGGVGRGETRTGQSEQVDEWRKDKKRGKEETHMKGGEGDK